MKWYNPREIIKFLNDMRSKRFPLKIRILCWLGVVVFILWVSSVIAANLRTVFQKEEGGTVYNIKADNFYMASEMNFPNYVNNEFAAKEPENKPLSDPIAIALISKESEKLESTSYYTEFILIFGIDKNFTELSFSFGIPKGASSCEIPGKKDFNNYNLSEYEGRTLYPFLIKCMSEKPFDAQTNTAMFNLTYYYQK